MNNRKKRSIACLTLLVWLMVCLLPSGALYAEIDPLQGISKDTIIIQTPEDFLAFSKNCSLDTWSQGKTVVLANDISFGGIEFQPVPTFGGHFDGRGHIITGLILTDYLSPTGLFCRVQPTGIVENLTVYGRVCPSGQQENVGGIAGKNQGKIRNVTFYGAVTGDVNVGGIAGWNGTEGEIRNCHASGIVLGKNASGGIAGYNDGTIQNCENTAGVNTESIDPTLDLSRFDSTQWVSQIVSGETYDICNDTGGVAGYSAGLVLDCKNSGTIGYPHIGYNVGGIVGRSSGFLSGCENDGTIFGRKDIGGIAGQAEPYVIIAINKGLLDDLRKQINTLSNMMDTTLSDAESASETVSNRLSNIHDGVKDAGEYARDLGKQISSDVNEDVSEINRASMVLSNAITQMADITKDLPAISGTIGDMAEELARAARQLAQAGNYAEDAVAEMNRAAKELEKAAALWQEGSEQIIAGMEQIQSSIIIEDEEGARQGLQKVREGLTKLNEALGNMGQALQKLSQAMNGGTPVEVAEALGQLGEALSAISVNITEIQNGLQQLTDAISIEDVLFQEGLRNVSQGLSTIQKSTENIRKALNHLSRAGNDLESAVYRFTAAMNSLENAFERADVMAVQLTAVAEKLNNWVEYLKSVEPIQLVYSQEEIDASADGLYGSLQGVGSQLELLNNDVTEANSKLLDDLKKMNSQFLLIMNTLMDAIYDLGNPTVDDFISDDSEKDIASVTTGKIFQCRNRGSVEGDIGVGGIAGSMAIDDPLDPEDDTAGKRTYGHKQYKLKVILQQCVNEGSILSKRDFVGGVCGQVELGFVYRCENYGSVESESGSYAGGIAGVSNSSIRNCYSKCDVSGKNYVGGILGSGLSPAIRTSDSKVDRCVAVVTIPRAQQYYGAVSGQETGLFRDNVFVSETLAGISNVSYTGKAEPISESKLKELPELPNPFRKVTVRFMVEDQCLETLELDYGSSLAKEEFPPLPERENSYGYWDKDGLTNVRADTRVHAVYLSEITALKSNQSREDGKSIFLVEGRFDDSAYLETEAIPLDSETDSRVLESWKLTLHQRNGQQVEMRYLPEQEKADDVEIYQKKDDQWEKVSSKPFGSYLAFPVDRDELEIMVCKKTPEPLPIALGAASAAATGGIALFLWKRRNRKQTRNEEQQPETV